MNEDAFALRERRALPGTRKTAFFPALLAWVTVLIFFADLQNGQAAGTVVAWGDNSYLQTNVPAGLTNVVAVAGGSRHSLAVRSTGAVVGWGDNPHGEATPPSNLQDAVAVAAGQGFSLALRSNGVVTAWGSQTTVPAGLTNGVAIRACSDNAVVLKGDGAVVSWGTTSSVPAFLTNVVAIAAGNAHSLALPGDGTVVAWGDSTLGRTAVPSDLTNVVALAVGEFHSLALTGNGKVVSWGDNTYGQSTVPAGLSDVVAIAAGALHSLALKSDGTVVAWGDNTYGQTHTPSGLTNVIGIAAGRYHNLVVVGDGSPVIVVQPVSQYVVGTQQAFFRVTAAGRPLLSFQWQQDGADIAGATGSTLMLANLPTTGAGVYSVIVSNSLGSVRSVNVVLPPAWRRPFGLVVQPLDQSILCNEPATYRITADGFKPLSFQWLFNGVPISGATSTVLTLPNVTGDMAGEYAAVVTNVNGATTSRVASLTVIGQPPLITSRLTASGKQGVAFSYQITGLHTPTSFSADGLPAGLAVNTANGSIQGTPLESGIFNATIGTANPCASASTNLLVTITSSVPVITSSLTASGTEQAAFSYQITATDSPTGFGAQGLPQNLSVNPITGVISGIPVYAGASEVTVSASNVWGVGTARLQLTFANAPISGLSIANVVTNYSKPYLLDFQFTLRDDSDPTAGNALVVDPRLLSVAAFEDDVPVSPSETAVFIAGTSQSGSAKVLKAYLVLDFSESIASIANGDTNSDGISDAVDTMVGAAQTFVNQMPGDTQIGVYEFHREDVAPTNVIALTKDKVKVSTAIAGIWTNYVQNFPAGSRCWDALYAAIGGLGTSNRDEQHFVVFISDGRDESSTRTVANVVTAAKAGAVQVYCIGFGAEVDAATLQSITTPTSGRYYNATNAADLAAAFSQIGKDLKGQYILRWATLKRSSRSFMPSFQVTYQGLTAMSPSNPPPFVSGTNIVINTNVTPAETNETLIYTTNYFIPPYVPTTFAGDVTVGSLRLVADADVHPTGVTLRASYVPRYIRQLSLHYRANWPCTASLQSTNVGEMLYGWSLTETNDGAGGTWALLSSPNPQSLVDSIEFASFGKLITFTFRDVVSATNSFSLLQVDNTIYTNTGRQRFVFENTNAFVAVYPVLPFGTPVPWLIANGFADNFEAAELSDPDGDGALTWQEYQANTNPRDALSKFAVWSPTPTGPFGRYQVTFSTALNRTYRVEASDDLLTWQTLIDGISGTGANLTVNDGRNRIGVTQTYYRVAVY